MAVAETTVDSSHGYRGTRFQGYIFVSAFQCVPKQHR